MSRLSYWDHFLQNSGLQGESHFLEKIFSAMNLVDDKRNNYESYKWKTMREKLHRLGFLLVGWLVGCCCCCCRNWAIYCDYNHCYCH